MAGTDADPASFPSVFACMRPPRIANVQVHRLHPHLFACTRIPEQTSLAHPVWRNIYIV